MATIANLEGLLAGIGLETPVPQYQAADILAKPIDIYRSYLAAFLSSALTLDAAMVYEAINVTSDVSRSDLDVVIPRLKLETADVRRDLRSVNLPRLLLPYISSRGASYGQETSHGLKDPLAPEKGRKKVVVEFSSPSVSIDFNDTHLRSTIVGSFVANLYECMGWDVVRLNYLGDWGKPIGLLAVGWQRYGSEDALKEDPIGHLFDVCSKISEDFKPEQQASKKAKEDGLDTAGIEGQGIYAERDAFFKMMEEGDEEALALWKQFRDITISDLESAYKRMGVRFDEYVGESQVKPETMAEVEAVLKEKGVLEESNGSWIIDFPKHGGKKGLGIAIIRGRTGSSTYLLRDIAAVIDRERAYGFDKMLYVVSIRQETHFSKIFTALDLMGRSDLLDKLQHVSIGRIQGISERIKDAHTLGAILDQSAQLIRDAMATGKETSHGGESGTPPAEEVVAAVAVGDSITVGALFGQDMAHKRISSSVFDVRRMASLDGNTGQGLQASHTQLALVIRKLKEQIAGTPETDQAPPEYDSLQKNEAVDLLRLMAQYPDVTTSAFRSLEPHAILSYLYRLNDAIHSCINPSDGEEEGGDAPTEAASTVEPESVGEQKAFLSLYENACQVLENGLQLLSIPTVA
ncbi:arginyl-tRNA synthetase [Grosmannia clavigera kw1407]|uniref:arginine--tRNA ligase n=1 Tax=Grosmannia clavigera (strain kw1407 / UAMH 11150) TaxID=655863 RepID=F0XPE8_GROCL|nr:arginyl-tRNA synthetase [Grosmannia clavigera kw1407]EFX00441.1 arginyl-tRNA synthetase [Grosmannia clavigera kw1407]